MKRLHAGDPVSPATTGGPSITRLNKQTWHMAGQGWEGCPLGNVHCRKEGWLRVNYISVIFYWGFLVLWKFNVFIILLLNSVHSSIYYTAPWVYILVVQKSNQSIRPNYEHPWGSMEGIYSIRFSSYALLTDINLLGYWNHRITQQILPSLRKGLHTYYTTMDLWTRNICKYDSQIDGVASL